MRGKMENDCRVLGKNTYVEPTIWTIEWAQAHLNILFRDRTKLGSRKTRYRASSAPRPLHSRSDCQSQVRSPASQPLEKVMRTSNFGSV